MYVVLSGSSFRRFKTTQGAHAILVKRNPSGPRILIQGLARGIDSRREQVDWFEVTADFLNASRSKKDIRLMLRSIRDHWQGSERSRTQEREISKESQPFFRADFGRQDFSRPGQGGSGVDGYW